MPEKFTLTNEEFAKIMDHANKVMAAVNELRNYWLELYGECNLRESQENQTKRTEP